MTRKTALALAHVAGYHADKKTFTRLIVESHVGRQRMNDAYQGGGAARLAGVRCDCSECKAARGKLTA